MYSQIYTYEQFFKKTVAAYDPKNPSKSGLKQETISPEFNIKIRKHIWQVHELYL